MSVALSKDDDGFITTGKDPNYINSTILTTVSSAPTSIQPSADAGPSAPLAKSGGLDCIRFP
jgi:hypothetical protein